MTCPICNDTFMVIVAGPDSFGMYDTDDCPCQLTERALPEAEGVPLSGREASSAGTSLPSASESASDPVIQPEMRQ